MKNEKLKEIIKHQKNIINNLENKLDFQRLENYKLENKILKAIECIENNMQYDDNIDDYWTTTNELLEILKGSESDDSKRNV